MNRFLRSSRRLEPIFGSSTAPGPGRAISAYAVAFVLAAAVGVGGVARAGVFVVDRTDDASPIVASDCNIADDDCSLRGAISRANAIPDLDTIFLNAETYTIDLASGPDTGDIDIVYDVNINGNGAVIDVQMADRAFEIMPGATVTIADLTVQGGDTPFSGGAIVNGGALTLEGVTITDNSAAAYGGGVYSYGVGLTVTDGSRIIGNSAADYGGGITVASSTMTVIDSTIAGNLSGGDGGGVYMLFAGGAEVRGSTISWNTAVNGGGLWISSPSEPILVINSTVYGNAADTGGGLWLGAGQPTFASLNFTTLSNNTAAVGSALHAEGDLYFVNTVISGSCSLTRLPFSQGGNLESPGDTCMMASPSLSGVEDPMLSQLGRFGGPTQTVLPLPGSPVLGLGPDNHCTQQPFDQRGLPRSGPPCDAGAVARQPDDPDPLFLDGFESGDTTVWTSMSS